MSERKTPRLPGPREDAEDRKAARRPKVPDLAQTEGIALRILALRDHGEEELRGKLRKKGATEATIDRVIARCRAWGYLDDARVVAREVELLVVDQWGPARIRQKLVTRGLDAELVAEQLAAKATRERLREIASSRLERRFGTSDTLDERTRARAFRHLCGRGYPPELVRELLFRR
ncbi:MAG: regulatory protein RecX [Myxococcales bacterium]|nr:regulatory protein RecX [Myxococcales bacterium]